MALCVHILFAINKMQTGLQNFIDTKKNDENWIRQGEEATKQGLILPILQYVGWNPFDVQEVFPEYSVQNGRVDYSLRVNNYNKVFIEVKKVGEDLERHQEQLLRYAFQHGVKLAILTNGLLWWFYLPLHEGSWEQRRFYTIDVQSQDSADIVEKLGAFLAKSDVVSGRAVINAENIYNSRQKGEIIAQTLPKAWRKLLSENDDLLAELVAETVEKLCGYKPESTVAIQYLKDISGQAGLLSIPKKFRQRTIVEENIVHQNDLSESEIGKYNTNSLAENGKPVSFEFDHQTYSVNSWINLLKTFVKLIAERHPNELTKLTSLVGKQRPYFTTNSSLLRKASQIPNSSIYFETHFSANGIMRLIGHALLTMGYSSDSIKINSSFNTKG